jgi:2-polyprenyl-3-methyl-5-hydroxy-6-metoxy-1,4-benzoquinol methylase
MLPEETSREAMPLITRQTLERFMEESDRRGGPNAAECVAFWRDTEYQPDFTIDENLDPFSSEYVAQQMRLYEEISGRTYVAAVCEQTVFDIESHIAAPNVYGFLDAKGVAKHLTALALMVGDTALERGHHVLEMGCGWGFAAETLAQMGMRVTGVDINPQFVKLCQTREARLKLGNQFFHSSFEDFQSDELFDAILFYESLHHSADAAGLLRKMHRFLKPDGFIILCAEPFFGRWRTWGMRLDPLSVYCIRKFGWFESGWSVCFIKSVFRRLGMNARYINHGIHEYTQHMIARPSQIFDLDHYDLWSGENTGWDLEPEFLVSKGKSRLVLRDLPSSARSLKLELYNFSPKPLKVRMWRNSEHGWSLELQCGRNEIPVPGFDPSLPLYLSFDGKTWIPQKVLGNGDTRQLSFHLKNLIME